VATGALHGRAGRQDPALREHDGLSQQALAELVGVASSAVADWERGARQPSLDNFLAMVHQFGVAGVSLLGADLPAAAAPDRRGPPAANQDTDRQPPGSGHRHGRRPTEPAADQQQGRSPRHRERVEADTARLAEAAARPPTTTRSDQPAPQPRRPPSLPSRTTTTATMPSSRPRRVGPGSLTAALQRGGVERARLVALYQQRGLSIRKVAAELGLPPKQVGQLLDHYGIPRHPVTLPTVAALPPTAELAARYQAGWTLRKIAAHYQVSYSRVRSLLLAEPTVRLRPSPNQARRQPDSSQ